MPVRLRVITNSEIATHRTCARRHHYRYELLLRPRSSDKALHTGHQAHDFQELWWAEERRAALAMPSEPLIGALMAGYDARWGDETQWESREVENEHYVTLGEPVMGTQLVLGSKLDGLVINTRTLELYVREFKTTAYDIAPGSMYWQSIRLNTQIDTYSYILRQEGVEVSGTLYDVVHKPRLEPLKATPADQIKWTKAKPATKNKPAEPSRPYAGVRLKDETDDEFAARVALTIGEEPERYYGRAIIRRAAEQIEEFVDELEHYSRQLIVAPPHRNPDSCIKFNRLCEYHPLCSGYGSEREYDKAPARHSELDRAADVEAGAPLQQDTK